MSELGYSLSTYNNVSFFAPLLFLFVSLPPALLIVGALYLLIKVIKKEFDLRIWTSVYKGLRLVYGDQLEKKGGKYYLFNWRVSPLMLFWLFFSFAVIAACTAVSFWSEYLLTESDRCTGDMDCFAYNQTTLVQDAPLKDNCTQYEDSNYMILCYRFAFNYVGAIGNSGSVFVVGSLVLNIQSALAAAAYSIRNKLLKRLASFALWMYFTLSFFILVVGPLLFLRTPLILARVEETRNTRVQFAAYFLTFNVAFQVAGPLYACSIHRQTADDGSKGALDAVNISNKAMDKDVNSNRAMDDVDPSGQEDATV